MKNALWLCFVLTLSACGNEPIPNVNEVPLVETDENPENEYTLLLDSAIYGNLWDMKGIDGSAVRLFGFSNSNIAKVITVVEHNTEYAMAVLNIEHGGLNHRDLSIGTHYTYDYLTGNPNSSINVNVWGCLLHTKYDSPYYDSPAHQTEVWVDATPDVNYKRINYIARWFDSEGNHEFQVQGQVDVNIKH